MEKTIDFNRNLTFTVNLINGRLIYIFLISIHLILYFNCEAIGLF
jgi:hypothetical protein